MPKRDVIRRIDLQQGAAGPVTPVTGLVIVLPDPGNPPLTLADLERFFAIVDDQLRVKAALYVGRLAGGHVGLFGDTDLLRAYLEATDPSNTPYFAVGNHPGEAGSEWLRLGFPEQPGIYLEDTGGAYPQVRVDVATLKGQIDHGGLAGLGDDDHPQYLPRVEAFTPTASQAGQVLFSTDGLALTAELPLTAPDVGWLINEAGYLLVCG